MKSEKEANELGEPGAVPKIHGLRALLEWRIRSPAPVAEFISFRGSNRIVNPDAKKAAHLDLHVVYLLALLVSIALVVLPIGWALVVIGILPQGLILTRAADLRRYQRPATPHILLHEVSLVLVVALCAVGWYFLHTPR